MKNFNIQILRRRKEGGFALESVDASISPGESIQELSDFSGIRLAGGFPDLFPSDQVPLSPALQLNADLGEFSPGELLNLANAEFFWKDQVVFRNYTLEPDNRVAVLSADTGALSRFVEIWGGILDITPLLTRGYHPSFINSSKVEIERRGQGLTVTATIKSPVDLDRCSYCGFCGPACPEECLDRNLFIDFDKCTLCGACASACPNGAIDLYAHETVELDVAALLCLSDTGMEIPRGLPLVYREEKLDQLISSICRIEVDEVISVDSAICQHGTREKSPGCTLCRHACREQAISYRDGAPIIDHMKCTACGRCTGLCPTGALQDERFNDRAFASYVAQLEIRPGTTIVIGEAEMLHSFWWRNRNKRFTDVLFMEYPSIMGLNLWHFLALFARGCGRVVLLQDYDNDDTVPTRQVRLANRVLEILFGVTDAVSLTPVNKACDFIKSQEPLVSESLPSQAFRGRRRELARTLLFLLDHGEGSGTVEPELAVSFGGIVCDTSRCTQCLACLNECHQQALQADETRYALKFLPILCVQCGMCAGVCPEDALKLAPGLVLQKGFFETVVLAEAEPARCRECGKVFGTIKSLEKVQGLLSGRDDIDVELFEYCEDCRVKRFFEQDEATI